MNKQSFLTFLFTFFLSITGSKVHAQDIEVPNSDGITIYYNLYNNTELTVNYRDYSDGENCYNVAGPIVIPDSVYYNGHFYPVTRIGASAFHDCDIISITLPPTIKDVYIDAFKNCHLLGVVHISDLEAWCNINYEDEFTRFQSSNPMQKAQHLFLNGVEVKDLTIPNSVRFIKYATFAGCGGLTSITIPNSVEAIDHCAFLDCSSVTSITIPNSVTRINIGVFSGCRSLTSITIPNSVKSIEQWAFQNCSGLTSIVSEIENPFAIYEDVFNCSDKDIYATATLVVPPGKKSAYQNTAGWNKFQNIVEAELVGYEFEDNGIRYKIGENNTVSVVSRDAKYSGDVVIPSQVSYNGSNYDVTSIGSSAFEGCVDLTSVSIPSSVTTIGGAAFYYCTGLKTVDIPNGVTTIGEGAFSKCGDLTSVTIPGTVTAIESNAFFQCYALTQITSWIENPFSINSNVFPTSVYSNAALNVPSGKKTVYQNTSGWKKFENMSESSKCAKPIISYSNGKISFSCETEGVEFHYTISNTNSSTGVGNSVNFSPTVNISVYASKSGFANSDTSTAEIVVPAGLRGDLTGDGQVNVADHVELSKIILGQ